MPRARWVCHLCGARDTAISYDAARRLFRNHYLTHHYSEGSSGQ